MPGQIYSQQDFTNALLNLLPRGRVWPRDPDSTMFAFWEAMAGTWKRNSDAAIGLANDSPPFSLNQMLPEWELTLDLPDDCAPAGQTIQQRVNAVVTKFAASGGQSAAYFIALAEALGYANVTITQYAPFRVDRSTVETPLYDEGWFFVWTLNAPDLPVVYFTVDITTVESPLYSLQGDELECTIEKYKPAHTIVLFSGHT